MRPTVKAFITICAETLQTEEPIYEFGSLQVAGQGNYGDIRPLFHDKKYVGADMQAGPGVDVILDLHNINLLSESVGTVIILDTLEHVEFPRKALNEIYRILKPNGLLIISVPMYFPVHNYPFDYWRFTPEGLKSLMRPFSETIVNHAGRNNLPHTVVGIAFKGRRQNGLSEINKNIDRWKVDWKNPNGKITTRAIKQLKSSLYPFMPSFVLKYYRRMRTICQTVVKKNTPD